jgi:hypothetical protein
MAMCSAVLPLVSFTDARDKESARLQKRILRLAQPRTCALIFAPFSSSIVISSALSSNAHECSAVLPSAPARSDQASEDARQRTTRICSKRRDKGRTARVYIGAVG